MSASAEEAALRLRAEHPDLDPLELDPAEAEALLATLGAVRPPLPEVLVAWERLIP